MGTSRRQFLISAHKLFDLLVMVLAFAAATAAVLNRTAGITFEEFISMRVKVQNFVLFSGLLLVWHLIFLSLGLYQSRRLLTWRAEIFDASKAATAGAAAIAVAAFAFNITLVSTTFLLVFWVASTGATVASRVALRLLLAHVRARGHNLRHALVVGTNPRAVEFARQIASKPELGYRIAGFVDKDWPGLREFPPDVGNVVCDLRGFKRFVRSHIVDEVVLALPIRSFYSEASRIVAICETQGITVRFVTALFDGRGAQSRAEEFEGHSVITMNPPALLEGWPALVKRMMDIVFSAAAILALAPLLLTVAVLIKRHSPGPVFFVQKRLGLNKRVFLLYKFRTMVPDAERRIGELLEQNEMSGPVFKIKDDPRITPLGRFLRKTSIDELPQLFNVLKGDMSLVGPRPLPIRDYEGFDQDWHRRRFSVRPGITCLWQISGRNSITFDRWMEMDMEYIDNWSLWLDVRILVNTVPAVIRGTGAA